jgi:predicted MFS family arabinose efflux permease
LRTDAQRIKAKTSWGIVWLAVFAGIVAGLQVGKVPPVLSVLRNELGIDLVTAGWVASLFSGCGALLGMVTGLIIDRLGARTVIYSCTALLGLGSLIGGIAPSVTVLFLGRLVEGVGFVGMVVAAPAIITAASKEEDCALTLSIWAIYMPAGMAIAMAASPFLLERVGWRGIWLINVAVIFACLMALVWILAPRRWSDPTGGSGRQRSWQDVRRSLSLPGPWILGGCFMLYTIQFFAVMTWLPTFLIDSLGISSTNAALISAAVVFINIFGNLSVAWLISRGVQRWFLIAFAYTVIAIASVGIFSMWVSGMFKVPLTFVFGIFGGLLPPAVLASAPLHSPSPEQVATTNGIIVQGSHIGSLVGPPIMAMAVNVLGGWQHTYWLMLICSLIGIGFVMWLKGVEYNR